MGVLETTLPISCAMTVPATPDTTASPEIIKNFFISTTSFSMYSAELGGILTNRHYTHSRVQPPAVFASQTR
jgi:hypothetical protein